MNNNNYNNNNNIIKMQETMETKIELHDRKDLLLEKEQKKPQLCLTVKHMCVVLMLSTYIITATSYNIYKWSASSKGYSILVVIVALFPYFSIPVTILNCVSLILYNPFYKNAKSLLKLSISPYLCFRIVTRGDTPEFVIKNAIYNRDLCKKFGLTQFIVEIVSDKPINCPEKDIREIIVPKSYRSKNGSLYKCRALNYCLESHVNELAGNNWIVHLDEETQLTEAALSGIIHFVTEGKGDIGQGPICYARGAIIRNWVTTLADSMRIAIDYSLFRFQFAFLNRPVFGLKGSYVVVRNSVEMDVGFDFGPDGSIAEDCYFALKAWSKGYKFEFITGEMHEISPFTFRDFIRQRRRWFVGQMYTVLSKEIPLINRLGVSFSLMCCIFMPLSLSNVITDQFIYFPKPFIFCILNGFVGGTFSFLYCFGTFISCYKRDWSWIRLIIVSTLCAICVIPFAASMECIAVCWGLFTLKSNHFFVVQKDFSKQNNQKGHMKVV